MGGKKWRQDRREMKSKELKISKKDKKRGRVDK